MAAFSCWKVPNRGRSQLYVAYIPWKQNFCVSGFFVTLYLILVESIKVISAFCLIASFTRTSVTIGNCGPIITGVFGLMIPAFA